MVLRDLLGEERRENIGKVYLPRVFEVAFRKLEIH
jgi:hypothetical protein